MTFLFNRMRLVEPKFEIDNKNRVICQTHTNYPYFISPDKDYFEDLALDSELTCKTCLHYLNDDCYFPKIKIDKIESERLKSNKYLCNLCGNRMDRMFTIIQKLYYIEQLDIILPLICCNCFDDLNDNEFISKTKRNIYASMYLILSLLFLLCCVPFFLIGNTLILAIYFVLLTPILIILLRKYNLRIKHRLRGIKFYKNYFLNNGTNIKVK